MDDMKRKASKNGKRMHKRKPVADNRFAKKMQQRRILRVKATGIVRRIDDLGRIVVPKEIRRTLRIREGDPLEIYTQADGSVILKKYSPVGELSEYAEELAKSMESALERTTLICDKDVVVAASGLNRREYLGKSISKELGEAIEGRRGIVKNSREADTFIPIGKIEKAESFSGQLIQPIISEGQTIGAVVLLEYGSNKPLGEAEIKSAGIAAAFIGSQMEQ